MKFEIFQPADFWEVEVQEAQRDTIASSTPEIVEAIASMGPGWTVRDDDGTILGCSGMAPHHAEDGVWLAWAVFSSSIKGRGLSLIRFARRIFESWGAPLVLYVKPDHEEAARFARALGFAFERVEDGPTFSGFHYYRRER